MAILPPSEDKLFNTPPPPPEEVLYPSTNATDSILGGVSNLLKSSLIPNQDTVLKPLSGSPTEMLGQALSPTEGLTRAYATEKAGVNQITSKLQQSGDIGPIGKFVLDTAGDPATWVGMKESLLPDEVKAQVPEILQKTTEIPERATEMSGFNEPSPKPEELQQAIKNVQDGVSQVVKDHGAMQNKAMEDAGLPVSKQDIADSVRKYNNPYNLDLNKPLELPESMTKNAPPTEDQPMRALQKGDVVTATHPTEAPIVLKYNYPGVMPGIKDPGFDLQTPVKNPNASWSHPVDSTLAQSTLESYGYKVPDSLPQEGFEAPKAMNMPYKIGDHDTPEQLMTEIERFKANQDFIAPQDRIKAAEYFKDQIKQTPGMDFTQTVKGKTMGVLKSQYGDLSQITQTNSPALQAAKNKFGNLYDTLDNISKQISEGPGAGEAYLRKLFTTKSASAKDDIQALATVDKLQGTNTLDTLFKKFAGESYGKVLGEHVGSIFKIPYAMATSPRNVITPLMKYGPNVANLAKFTGLGAAEKGFSLNQSSPESYSDLQSLKDRLNNAQ